MTREEFLSGAAVIAGTEKGTLRRLAALLGLKERTLYAIQQGTRPVPVRYAVALRSALDRADERGAAVALVASGCQRVVLAAERSGCSREDALAAVAAWAGLVMAGAFTLPPRRPVGPSRR